MRYAVLFGRRSGRGRRGAARLEQTLTGLRRHGHEAHALDAPDLAGAHRACAQAVADGVDVLVVVGGDGAVRLAAAHCVRSGTAVAMVPGGSGNDTAASLGVPSRAGDAIDLAATGTRRRIDVIEVSTRRSEGSAPEQPTYVVGSVPAAVDALIAARSLRVPAVLGPARYAVATLVEIPGMSARGYRLGLDERERQCSALVLTVCNLPVFGGGMRIAPDADPSDGLLDVVTIDAVSPAAAVTLLRRVFRGTHTHHPAVRIERCSSVSIQGPRLTAFGDGDPVGALPLTCTVVPSSLDVITAEPSTGR